MATKLPSSSVTPATSSAEGRNPLIWSEDLCDFLNAIDTYNSTVPEAVTSFYLKKSGMELKDERIPKLVTLAVDKLLSEIIYEAKQMSILRQQTVRSSKRKQDMQETLETVDLASALSNVNVVLRRKRSKQDS